MLVYEAILGASSAYKMSPRPSLPCVPDLSSHENSSILGLNAIRKVHEVKLNGVACKNPLQVQAEDFLSLISKVYLWRKISEGTVRQCNLFLVMQLLVKD